MGMPQTTRRYTVDEVLAFPDDGNRYELVRGELLVSPPPRNLHQLVVGELHGQLWEYLRPLRHVARVILSPSAITWPDDILVQPDIFVVPADQAQGEWPDMQTLLLAIEVSSPSTARYDRVVKRRVYQDHGVGVYWIVDADSGVVEVWRPDDARPEIVTDVLRWRVGPDAPELAIDLREVLEREPGAERG